MVHAVGLPAVGDNVRVSSSRPVGTKGVPRAQREQLILDAATVEFGRFGYAGAALTAVAAQAGVSKPLVLSYFGSKDGLYIACVQRAGANLMDSVEAVLTTRQPPPQMAEDTLTAIFAALAPRPHDWNVVNDRTPPTGGQRTRRHDASAPPSPTRPRVVSRPSPTWPHVADADDVSPVTDVWITAVTACVDWWLRDPDESAIQMSRRSRRVLNAFTAGLHREHGPLDTDNQDVT